MWEPSGSPPAGNGETSTLPPSAPPGPGITSDLPRPSRIGRYDIKAVIGAGGHGIVYHGVHRYLRVTGAIKVMRYALGPDRQPAFLREARRLAGLRDHPAIAEIRDFGFYKDDLGDRLPYFVMDLIPGGRTIADHADANNLDQTRRLLLFARACDGVRFAHERGIIHLDLKPANILVSPPEQGRPPQPRIIDFGIARAADPGAETAAHRGISGTLVYMSPEQTDPQSPLDKRSDVYSLGVVLYELLCHHLPYDLRGRSAERQVQSIRLDPPNFESAGPRALPTPVRVILQKALSKNPDDRQQDACELLRDVRGWLEGRPPSPVGTGPIVRAAYGLRRVVARHPTLTSLVILVVAMAATRAVAVPLLYSETDATAWFMGRFASTAPFRSFEHVLMVVRTNASDAQAKPDVANPGAVRTHYAALLDALRPMAPKAVVLDFIFGGTTEYDGALAAAIRRMTESGVPVIVGSLPEGLDQQGIPRESHLGGLIRESVSRWGDLRISRDLAWVDLVGFRQGARPAESLAMATVTEIRAPGMRPVYSFDGWTDTLSIQFAPPSSDPEAQRPVDPALGGLAFRVAGVREAPSGTADSDPGVVAKLALQLPSADAADAATIGMENLIGSTPDPAAARRCPAKIVFVYNPKGEDQFVHASGPRPGAHGHAAAIEALMRNSLLRMPDIRGEVAILALGAGAGLALPLPLTRRRSWWPAWAAWGGAAAWAGAIAAVLVAGVVGASVFGYVVNPLVVVFAMLVAAGLSLVADRISRFHPQIVEVA